MPSKYIYIYIYIYIYMLGVSPIDDEKKHRQITITPNCIGLHAKKQEVRAAKVRVFEKSATEPKLNFLRYKYMCKGITPSQVLGVTQGHFKAEFNRFEFRVFLLLDRLP